MSELRKDPLTGRWVVVATERQARPRDFRARPSVSKKGICPFCPGNEHLTPSEIVAYRSNGSPGWTVRVVPNKFPALCPRGDLRTTEGGVYQVMSGIGAHEVMIESPRHQDSFSTMATYDLTNALSCYRERLLELKKDDRFVYVQIFKNVGEAAGASLEHPHSQLIALPTVPQGVVAELESSEAFYSGHWGCLLCEILRQELEAGERVIIDNPKFLAFAPFASRFPFEVWIVPKRHSFAYEETSAPEIEDLARVLGTVSRCVNGALNEPPFNLVLHTAPFDARHADARGYYHWHLEILPVLTKVAGFEWATGFFINPMPPEEAARHLAAAMALFDDRSDSPAWKLSSSLSEGSPRL